MGKNVSRLSLSFTLILHSECRLHYTGPSQIIFALIFVFRGVHGHTEGSRPWAWAENNLEGLMANVVGNYE